MSQEPLLDVQNLSVDYETSDGSLTAVDGLSFDIQPGEIFGIVGESGSGKSVTARSILRLIADNGTVNSDQIQFKGRDLTDLSQSEMNDIRGSEISIIFQDSLSSLNPVITNGEQIAESVRYSEDVDESTNFWTEMKRKYITGTNKKSESWQRAIDLLEKLGMPDAAQKATEYPHQLSGGMRQRVMVAQALAGEPDILIADEPTTALDVSIEAQFLNEIASIQEEMNMSVILISHDIGVIRETCDRCLVMYAGEAMEQGEVGQVIENPMHPYTEALIKSAPQVGVDKERLPTIEGTLPNLYSKPSGCPFKDRCSEAFNACSKSLKNYKPEEDRDVWCHLYSEEHEGQQSHKQ
jgi:peptide/nickel transport system ATP-binding protein